MTRVGIGLALAAAALAVVLWAPLPLFAALVVVVALLGAREFYDLAEAQGLEPFRWVGLSATAALVLAMELPLPVHILPAVLLACLVLVLARSLSVPERRATSVGDAASTLLGALYLGLSLGAVGAIRMYLGGASPLIFLLAVVWAGDIAALYTGRLWGRHPLAPRVSPKKTWEGAAGSLVAAALVGLGVGIWAGGTLPAPIVLAVLINLAAQTGDLVESLWKRGAQVKDSSGLLPGHGGVLDRVDALLLAAPVLWYYLAFFHS